MEFKDAVTQLFERSNAMQSYWGFYISVAAALLAFLGTAKRSRRVTQVLVALFVVIAGVNLDGIRDVARQRAMLRCLLEKTYVANAPPCRANEFRRDHELTCDGPLTGPNPLLEKWPSAEVMEGYLRTVHPPPVWGVVATHLLFDGAILGAIWFLQRGRRVTISEKPVAAAESGGH